MKENLAIIYQLRDFLQDCSNRQRRKRLSLIHDLDMEMYPFLSDKRQMSDRTGVHQVAQFQLGKIPQWPRP